MDLYHSRLIQDDLNDLSIRYKIPRDLHPRLPFEEFVMSELSDDAIGIYHQMFDFSGIRIPFSLFLLALIKHYRTYFSQLGPLGLNKVFTFEVLCRSLQIELTVTLFRVFQMLCKQGDWFSFAKPHAPSLIRIDDNPSSIDGPRHVAGSFSMADVRRLSTHVIKLRDMPEGVLVLYGLSRVWKSRVCDPVLQGADRNVIGIHDFLCLPKWTGAEVQEEPHLDIRPTLQMLTFYCTYPAVADAQKASTSGATSSHVAKRTRSALAKSSSSTTRPSLFVGDSDDESDGDDDVCVEIPLVTPLRFAAMIPSSGNQGRSSTDPTVEGPNTRDSLGKGIMADDAVAPSVGVSRPRPSFSPVPSFKDVSRDAIHADFFPFSVVEALSEDQLTAKMSVIHCMMMSHGGELLARYHGLLQSHHEYVQSADSRLKGYKEKVAGATGLELQVSTLKKQVSRLNDKLASSDASFAKSKAKGKERKKKIKFLTKSLDNLHAEVARLSATLNQATVLEAEKDEEILRLKKTPPEFASFFHGQFQDLVWKFLASDEFSKV
ncbi:hypothetical protein Tco_0746209 [Tanacetum coccineum]